MPAVGDRCVCEGDADSTRSKACGMLPIVRRASAAAVLLALVASCRTEPSASEGASADTTAVEPERAPADERPAPPVGDPFVGIEALRPRPWTGWPLENVDILTEAGWRIDPITGGFELEQWLVFAAEAEAFVLAIAPGEVTELRSESDGAIELVVDHGEGIESRYAPLSDALVHVGLPVTRGAAIGLARGRSLRLQVTVDGVAIDPLLVLRQPLHRWPGLLSTPPAQPPAE